MGRDPIRERVRTLIDPKYLFADHDHTGYIGVLRPHADGNHREVHALRSTSGRYILTNLYLEKYSTAPSSSGLNEGIAALEAQAQKHVCPVGIRSMSISGGFAIDLGDPEWTRILVTADGWRLSHEEPLFRRGPGSLPLPIPVQGGSLDILKQYLNLRNDHDWSLVLGYIVHAMQAVGPFLILVVQGEQGSSKTTFIRLLISLLDPNVAMLASIPKDERDLMVVAASRHVYALDNLGSLDPGLKDAMCRLSTGSGFVTRKMYTDRDVEAWAACRPIMLNGINELLIADDLADRAISITLLPISEHNRLTESKLWADFDKDRPAIFGALLDASVLALRNSKVLAFPLVPRMADAACYAAAAAPAWGDTPEGWLQSFNHNRQGVLERGLDSDMLARAVRSLLCTRPSWTGTYRELLAALDSLAPDEARASSTWPLRPHNLHNRLRLLAPGLRAFGINVDELGRRKQGYCVRLIQAAPPHDAQGVPGVPLTLLDLDKERIKRLGNGRDTPSTSASPESEQQQLSDRVEV